MTKWFDANPFLNRYQFGNPIRWAVHEGADLNLNDPTWDADKGMPVHAIGDGIVTFARFVPAPSTWGRKIVIRHVLPDGSVVHSRYAHLAAITVNEGDVVIRGQVVGTIGGEEYDLPNHLHFAISTSGILQTNPTYWPGDNRQAVLDNFVDPKQWLLQYNPAPVPHPTVVSYGIHDESGGNWMVQNGVRGPSLHSVALKAPTTINFTNYASNGIRLYVRLNWDYHPKGTLPDPRNPQDQDVFVNACIETIQRSNGVAGWIIGNEFNNPAEHPNGQALSPTYVAEIYNRIWDNVAADKPVSIGAIDPYFGPANFPFPNNRTYWSELLNKINGIDFINLHPKTQDSNPDNVDSTVTFSDPPLIGAYIHFNSYKQLLELVPATWRSRPVVLSEVNPQRQSPNGPLGWNVDTSAQWVNRATANVAAWNAQPGNMQVQEVIFYRWSFDEWALSGNAAALGAIKIL